MDRKNIGFWTLYDFANSIAIVVFFLYFSQWLVIDKGFSDFGYNMLFSIGSVLLLLTAPILGSRADRNGKHLTYLNRITVATFAFFILTSIVALFFSDKIYIAALFFLLANYFYQFSFVFYNALLHNIAPLNKQASISGIGQAGNWLGQLAGILIALPLATGAVYLFGEAGRAQTFLPATILFFILALPMLLWFRVPKSAHANNVKVGIRQEYQDQWRQFKDLVKAPGMGLFLLSYFFFNDAIITASNNFPIYLQNVWAISDKTKSFFLVGILCTSSIGAFFGGRIADRIGLKKSLLFVLGVWIIVLPALSTTYNFSVFVLLSTVMGLLFGATWTITRAVMATLCPEDKLNYGFSFYTLAERVSTFFGPLAWGLATLLLVNLGPVRYRIAAGLLTVFVAIGFIIAQKIEIKTNANP